MNLRKYIFIGILFGVSACKIPYNASDVFKEQASLPEDEAPHIKNSLEWWYFTGHLKDTAKNKKLGVEYVVFHFNPTNIRGGWMINMAVSDPENEKFYYDHKFFTKSKTQFAALPLNFHWNKKGIKSSFKGQSGRYEIEAQMDAHPVAYQLILNATKDVVLHDGVGYENYGDYAKAGYYTFPRLETKGNISIDNEKYSVEGEMWYDRQWNCSGVWERKVAWDWFSIQFEETNSELMLYRLYHLEKDVTLYGGTYTDEKGNSSFLESDQINISELESWESPHSEANYPVKWQIEIPSLALSTQVEAIFPDQELALNFGPLTKFFYWEGMCKANGTIGDLQVTGNSYVEMTNRFRID